MESKTQERKPAEVRRFEILVAARELFTERDYHHVSMDDVAKKVGISKAGVYLYFKSKPELFVAMIERGFNKLIATVEAGLADEAKKTLSDRLEVVYKAFEEYTPVIAAARRVFETGGILKAPRRHQRNFVQDMISRVDKLRGLFTVMFSRAQKEGEVRKDLAPEELARIFMGLGSSMAKFEVDFDSVKEVFLNGILAKEKK